MHDATTPAPWPDYTPVVGALFTLCNAPAESYTSNAHMLIAGMVDSLEDAIAVEEFLRHLYAEALETKRQMMEE